MPINQYIENRNKSYQTGNARKQSYRGGLLALDNTIVLDVLFTNGPARIEGGAPDYIITKRDILVGYIEAKELQSLHTERRDKIAIIDKRLESTQVQKDKRKPSWIWVEADNKNWFDTKLESINAKLSVTLDKEIDALDKTIAVKEKEINAVVYKLYQLTDEETLLVERG